MRCLCLCSVHISMNFGVDGVMQPNAFVYTCICLINLPVYLVLFSCVICFLNDFGGGICYCLFFLCEGWFVCVCLFIFWGCWSDAIGCFCSCMCLISLLIYLMLFSCVIFCFWVILVGGLLLFSFMFLLCEGWFVCVCLFIFLGCWSDATACFCLYMRLIDLRNRMLLFVHIFD